MILDIPSSQEILNLVTKLAHEKLKTKDDLERLIAIAVSSGRIDLLEDMAFQAKYVMGLLKIIQTKSVDHDQEYLNKLNEEFKSAYIRIQKLLAELLSGNSQFIQKIFEEKYLQLTQDSLRNLSNLCSDLAYFKLVLNDLKIKKDSK